LLFLYSSLRWFAGWLRRIGDCPSFFRRFFAGVRFVIAEGAEPHPGGARAYLALLQQTAEVAGAGEEQAS
jgi:hypothetical protein